MQGGISHDANRARLPDTRLLCIHCCRRCGLRYVRGRKVHRESIRTGVLPGNSSGWLSERTFRVGARAKPLLLHRLFRGRLGEEPVQYAAMPRPRHVGLGLFGAMLRPAGAARFLLPAAVPERRWQLQTGWAAILRRAAQRVASAFDRQKVSRRLLGLSRQRRRHSYRLDPIRVCLPA